MGTYVPKVKDREPKWFLVDAEGQVLGRLAARVAAILRGKDNPRFTPYLDTGEHVVVINCAKIKVTGDKLAQKEYHRVTGYPGGLRTKSLKDRIVSEPDGVVRDAIEGMLPNSKLGKQFCGKLRTYPGATHPHTAQTPTVVAPVKHRAPRALSTKTAPTGGNKPAAAQKK